MTVHSSVQSSGFIIKSEIEFEEYAYVLPDSIRDSDTYSDEPTGYNGQSKTQKWCNFSGSIEFFVPLSVADFDTEPNGNDSKCFSELQNKYEVSLKENEILKAQLNNSNKRNLDLQRVLGKRRKGSQPDQPEKIKVEYIQEVILIENGMERSSYISFFKLFSKPKARIYADNVLITNDQLSLLEAKEKPTAYLGALLYIIFDRETLLKSSITGKRCNRFKGRAAPQPLDPVKFNLACGNMNSCLFSKDLLK